MLTNSSSASPLTEREFSASLAAIARFEPSPFLAVAVSGGADSLALAILADRWARERSGRICALMIDHRLRPESGAEIERIRGWLSAREISHETLVWEGEKPQTRIQEAARAERYRLLDGWCRERGCLHLLTGHHRDDQIETHLIRRRARSGPDGLAGMSAVRELAHCRLLRPLLGISKGRLVAFLQAERQTFITDPSNTDPAFERSRMRREESIAPHKIDAWHVARETVALGAARAGRERERDALLGRFVGLHSVGFAVLDPASLAGTASNVERLLSRIVTAVGGGSYPPRRERLARLRVVLGVAARRRYTLGGCVFTHWRGRILVARELANSEPPLNLAAAECVIWDRRFEIRASPDAGGGYTVGYLGSNTHARFDRATLEHSWRKIPRFLLPNFPAVWDTNGVADVPHLGHRREGLVGVPQIVFRPVNPLTQAGFAVV